MTARRRRRAQADREAVKPSRWRACSPALPRCCSALCVASAAWAHATLLVLRSRPMAACWHSSPKMVQLHFNESDGAGGDRGHRCPAARRVTSRTRAVGQSVPDRSARRPAAGHANRQLSRGLAGRSSRGGIDGVLDRRRDRAAPHDRRWPYSNEVLIWLARIGVYLGLLVGVGGAFFAAWIGRGTRAGSTVSRGALAVGLVSAVAWLGLQGLDLPQPSASGGIVRRRRGRARSATSSGPSLLISIVEVMTIAWYAWKA